MPVDIPDYLAAINGILGSQLLATYMLIQAYRWLTVIALIMIREHKDD
jgi:hypothetical protein